MWGIPIDSYAIIQLFKQLEKQVPPATVCHIKVSHIALVFYKKPASVPEKGASEQREEERGMIRLHMSKCAQLSRTSYHGTGLTRTRLHNITGRGVLKAQKHLTYGTISIAAYRVGRSTKLIPYVSPLYTTQILPPPSPAYLRMPNSEPRWGSGGAVCCCMFLRNNEIFFPLLTRFFFSLAVGADGAVRTTLRRRTRTASLQPCTADEICALQVSVDGGRKKNSLHCNINRGTVGGVFLFFFWMGPEPELNRSSRYLVQGQI